MKEIVKWYEHMGIDEVILNEPGQLTKPLKKKLQKPIEEVSDLALKARRIADESSTIEELYHAVKNFNHLSIAKTAINTVFADGNPKAEFMAVGEAPGADEDERGIPFCGMSGKLLDQVLASVDLTRENNLYITNSVFWRPPGNRKPTAEENAVCLPFLEKHIALVNPKVLLLVGSTSASALLNSTETISRLRTKFYQYKNQYMEKPVFTAVIFHPSYLLRQPLQKKTVWFDLLKVKKEFV